LKFVVLRNPPLSQPHDREGEPALKIFRGNLRREQVARSISQQELAVLLGLNVCTICKIESGQLNVRWETIQRLWQAIGCSLSRLIEKTGKGNS
jgi:transcriptional regulator with XRE-family HTH domain